MLLKANIAFKPDNQNQVLLWGLKKVEVEFGLLAVAHHLMKLMKYRAKSCFLLYYRQNYRTKRKKRRKKNGCK